MTPCHHRGAGRGVGRREEEGFTTSGSDIPHRTELGRVDDRPINDVIQKNVHQLGRVESIGAQLISCLGESCIAGSEDGDTVSEVECASEASLLSCRCECVETVTLENDAEVLRNVDDCVDRVQSDIGVGDDSRVVRYDVRAELGVSSVREAIGDVLLVQDSDVVSVFLPNEDLVKTRLEEYLVTCVERSPQYCVTILGERREVESTRDDMVRENLGEPFRVSSYIFRYASDLSN